MEYIPGAHFAPNRSSSFKGSRKDIQTLIQDVLAKGKPISKTEADAGRGHHLLANIIWKAETSLSTGDCGRQVAKRWVWEQRLIAELERKVDTVLVEPEELF